MTTDERAFMVEAMALAASEHPHPNPRVGAVVLDASGAVIGSGAHAGPGTPHAEAIALSEAANRARGGTLVVTLEPCAHEGRTPPCVAVVVASGVSRVIVGAGDPDEHVAGRGIAALRDAGLDVVVGIPDLDAETVDPGYFHHRRTGRPLVTLKMASTLDGQAAAADGSSRWITSSEARADAHALRARADAILVGAGTVRADDPVLTARLEGYAGNQPRPVVVVGHKPVLPSSAIFARDPLVYAARPVELSSDVTVLPGPEGVDLGAMLDDLGKRAVVDLLVEGGPRVAGALIRHGLADRFVFYLAGALAGGSAIGTVAGEFAKVENMSKVVITAVRRIGPDVRIDAERA